MASPPDHAPRDLPSVKTKRSATKRQARPDPTGADSEQAPKTAKKLPAE